MKLSIEAVTHIADLIKIYLSEEEKSVYQSLLSTVLNYLAVFEELDTSSVPVTTQVTGLTNVLAEDITQPSLPQELALKNAHLAKNGYVNVPQVVNNRS